nr:MAG TPA: hypothetical protein [Caudoviricetes sp.]
MAAVMVFASDLDEKTIRTVQTSEGSFVSVPFAEIEVLDGFPVESDDYYIEKTPKYLQHVATNAIWQADVVLHKTRSEAVNEDLGTLSLAYNQAGKYLTLTSDTGLSSKIDGLGSGINSIINLDSFGSTKEVNDAATAGTTYKFTTAKRYAASEGHPIVKETEFSVAYPELPYRDGELKLTLGISSLDGNFSFEVQAANLPKFVENALTSDAFRNTQVEVEYTIDKGDSNPVTGTATTTAYQIGKNFLREIGHEKTDLNQWTVTYKVKPFNFTWFEGNVTITSDATTQKVGDSL